MWNEVTIDSPVDEIFYQPDSYKSCTLVDQAIEAGSFMNHQGVWIFWVCNRKDDKQNEFTED